MRNTLKHPCLFLLVFVLSCQLNPARGQLALEHVYPGGSYSTAASNFWFANQLFLLELDVSGWKYVRIDRVARQIDFYHLDHSFWKSVPFNMTTVLNPYANTQDILYISEHLFDLDDGIEFMYANLYYSGMNPPICVTQIVDEENAGLIFSVSNQYPSVKPNWHMQQYPIQSTPAGTKLILSAIQNDSAYVYGLPGELSTELGQTWEQTRGVDMIGLFPNPASTEVAVLLPSQLSSAPMDIISSEGKVVMTMTVSTNMPPIDIRTLPSGLYVCRIQGVEGRVHVGSFIKN